jgi:DNA-binding transcriptional LysR family regulator
VDRLQSMKVFVAVAQHTGFAAAARELRMSTAAVSKHVSSLESRISARLFDRTTRRVGLTEAGRVYLERCLECLHALDDADASVGAMSKQPLGILRVTAPIDFGQRLFPVLEQVMKAHPQLGTDLRLSNRVVDMVEEGVDVAVRVATQLDGAYVARPLARSRLRLMAAPEYLRKHGPPKRPDDLLAHRNLVFTEPRPYDELSFTRGKQKQRIKLPYVMSSNSGEALMSAMRAGVGIGLAPSFMSSEDLESGRLVPVLPDWLLPEFQVCAVYPHRRFLSPKVRVFVEAMRAEYGDGSRDPWWPSRLE